MDAFDAYKTLIAFTGDHWVLFLLAASAISILAFGIAAMGDTHSTYTIEDEES